MLREMYLAYSTIIEMLKDRGYNVPDHYDNIEIYEDPNYTIEIITSSGFIFTSKLYADTPKK